MDKEDKEIAGIEIAGRVDRDGRLELDMETTVNDAFPEFTVYRWIDKDDAIELIEH